MCVHDLASALNLSLRLIDHKSSTVPGYVLEAGSAGCLVLVLGAGHKMVVLQVGCSLVQHLAVVILHRHAEADLQLPLLDD